jgi:molybdate transport system substrate-binding protein
MDMPTRRIVLGGAAASGFALPFTVRGQPPGMLIFAAASLKNALDDIAAAWTRETGKPTPRISYAASPVLARQIEQAAPADLFISADGVWMDYLAVRKLIRLETRVDLLNNRIVLIAIRESRTAVNLVPGVDLKGALAGGRLAMASVDSVPAGKYGKAALEKLGAWTGVKDHIAQAENVRSALLLVSRGEAPLGIVYRTDAAADDKVRIVATFPEEFHPPIVYPMAIPRDARDADAPAFATWLRGPQARAVFERYGFGIVKG